MNPYDQPPRPPTRRKPLGDATQRANINSTPPRRNKLDAVTSSSPGPVPHHESLTENGTLAVRTATDSPKHKRLSALSDERDESSKRDSQISSTSTNASATGRRRKTHIGPWQLGKVIGKGGCGRVRLVKHRFTGVHAAAKIISKKTAEKLRPQSLTNLVKTSQGCQAFAGGQVIPFGIEREMVIMKLLEHPNVVRLYDVWENRNEIYLIMEYVDGGELFDYITGREVLEEYEVVYLFRQIIAALLHCHRLNIHHRDLKPENILLDQENMTVKLVDFGMAALQPRGKFLSTPCGSPHYAAPEVLCGQQYNGAKADIWSCGVILYVMLTSTTPFSMPPDADTRNLEPMFRSIRAAKYYMPEDLSPEAKDLIRQILKPDPKQRPSLERIWDHPFLHKYDTHFGLNAENSKMEHWVGPQPVIGEWNIKRREDIDREIFRNLRTLWHSETEHSLIQKLLNEEPNEEKYFYVALQKHREEQLENYVHSPGGMGYSTSDYHHDKPVTAQAKNILLPLPGHKRTKSDFSILNDEHLHSKHSLHEPPPSARSYDPYRASRDPIVRDNGNYTNVTVHGSITRKGNLRKASTAVGVHHPSSSRVEALRKLSHRNSAASSAASSWRGLPATSVTVYRRSISRASVGSSVYPSSPPVPGSIRARNAHKRGVSFTHLRRSSTTSALTGHDSISEQRSRDQGQNVRTPDGHSAAELEKTAASRAARAEQVRDRPDDTLPMPKQRLGAKKPRPGSHYIENEARKVSTELGMLCEEAFRSSVGSSVHTSTTDKPNPCDTPPSSVSNYRGSGPSPRLVDKAAMFGDTITLHNRPLPALPIDTPNTFAKNELAEARSRIAARRALESNNDTSKLDEVLDHLDRLLGTDLTKLSVGDSRRTSSGPADARGSTYMGQLPMISEEESGRCGAGDGRSHGNGRQDSRSATDPVRRRVLHLQKLSTQPQHGGNTIRVIEPASPTNLIAPLNIRKVSNSSTSSQSSGSGGQQKQRPGIIIGQEKLSSRQSHFPSFALEPIRESQEHARQATENANLAASTKKKGWFSRLNKPSPKGEHERKERQPGPAIPEQWQDLDDRGERRETERKTKRASDAHSGGSEDSEFPVREGERGESKGRTGFMRMFGKKAATKKDTRVEGLALASDADDARSVSSTLNAYAAAPLTHHDSLADPNEHSPLQRIELQQSWLSRILHIKPASKILCYHISRGKLRSELVRLFKAWERYGVRDISLDRARNVISCRVDKVNYLKIKEVQFVVELYVVLKHGRRAQLSMARFTQIKGAASSFRKVVDAVEGLMHEKGYLVEDKDVWAGMRDMLVDGGGSA